MKRPPRSALRLGLLIDPKRDPSYLHVNASVVSIGLTPDQIARIDRDPEYRPDASDPYNKIRNVGDVHGLRFTDLAITSQGNSDDRERHLYAWELRYRDVYAVELRDAIIMAHTLKMIDAKLDKLTEKYGRPETFGAYLARVAAAIGAETFVEYDPHQTKRGSYDDNLFAFHSIRDGIYCVDAIVRAWQQENQTPAERIA